MKTRMSVVVLFAALAGLGCLGCSQGPKKQKLVTAKGKVQLDGNSHGPASLTFNPVAAQKGDPRPTVGAAVAADGSFTCTTYKTGDGAPPGEYTVTLGGASSDAGSTDPSAMMKSITGGGTKTQPLKVTIPPEGASSLELKFTSVKDSGTQKPGAILGAPTQ